MVALYVVAVALRRETEFSRRGSSLNIVPSRLMARIGSDENGFTVLRWKNGEASVPGLRPLGAAGTPRVVSVKFHWINLTDSFTGLDCQVNSKDVLSGCIEPGAPP